MQKPIIAVDVDDVCANLIGEWVRRYNEEYRDTLLPEHVKSWNIHEFMPRAPSRQAVHDLLAAPDFYDRVLPIDGARDTVEALRQHGRVIYLTACHENTVDQKLRWLKRWGFVDSNLDFIAAKDKALVKADYLFDDCPANVESFPGLGFLVNHHHNLSVKATVPRGPFVHAPFFVHKVKQLHGASSSGAK